MEIQTFIILNQFNDNSEFGENEKQKSCQIFDIYEPRKLTFKNTVPRKIIHRSKKQILLKYSQIMIIFPHFLDKTRSGDMSRAQSIFSADKDLSHNHFQDKNITFYYSFSGFSIFLCLRHWYYVF